MCDNGIETVVVVVGRVIRYGFRHGFYGVLIAVSRKGRRERERGRGRKGWNGNGRSGADKTDDGCTCINKSEKKRRRLIASFCKDVCSRNYLSVRLICCLSFFYRVQGKKIVSYCCVFLDVFRGWYLQNYFLKCYYVLFKRKNFWKKLRGEKFSTFINLRDILIIIIENFVQYY